MRSKVRFRFTQEPHPAIRSLPGVEARLQEVVDDVLAGVRVGKFAEGLHYDGGVNPGTRRSRGYVVAVSAYASRSEIVHGHMVRAVTGA